MASSSGDSTATATASAQDAMDLRKRKRMLSNRESARRSRQRKQRHLDELTAQVGLLREENARIAAALSATGRQYVAVEAENSVLRTQAAELGCRLQSLNEILACMNSEFYGGGCGDAYGGDVGGGDDGGVMGMMMRPWGMMMDVGSVDLYQYS